MGRRDAGRYDSHYPDRKLAAPEPDVEQTAIWYPRYTIKLLGAHPSIEIARGSNGEWCD